MPILTLASTSTNRALLRCAVGTITGRDDKGMAIQDYSNRTELQKSLNIARGLHPTSTSDVTGTTVSYDADIYRNLDTMGNKEACQVNYSTSKYLHRSVETRNDLDYSPPMFQLQLIGSQQQVEPGQPELELEHSKLCPSTSQSSLAVSPSLA